MAAAIFKRKYIYIAALKQHWQKIAAAAKVTMLHPY
jgi:hypothetical protein